MIQITTKKGLAFYYFLTAFAMINIIFLIYNAEMLEKAELASIETRYNLFPSKQPLNNIIIVAEDDSSIKSGSLGFPVSRSYYAKFLEKSRQGGAKLVAFDKMFLSANAEDDADLALYSEFTQTNNIILANYISPNDNGFLQTSHDLFRKYAAGEGFINMFLGKNTTIFGTKLIYRDGNYYIPCFSAEIFKQLKGINNIDGYLAANYKLYKGELLINYAGGPGTFTRYSLSDVVSDNFDVSLFKDKIILIGSTYAASQDFYSTPFGKSQLKYAASSVRTPGIEIHANILNTLINKNNFTRINYNYFSFLIIGLFTAVLMVPVFSLSFIVISLFAASAMWGISTVMLFKNLILIDSIPVIIAIVSLYLASTSFRIVSEWLEKKKIHSMFGKYLPPEVVEHLMKSKEKLSVGGEAKEISILFSDIANFTTISEILTPEKLVHLLNNYFDLMINVIMKHNGILDKYIGDAIMALFGTPIDNANHADMAISTALDMKKNTLLLKDMWYKECGIDFDVRIGVSSGKVVVGNIGSEKRMEYTAIGDNVNLASRLEGVNKFFGTNIIISEFTLERLNFRNRYIIRELDLIRVKGKDFPVRIYEVMCFSEDDADKSIEKKAVLFEQALKYYHEMNFEKALEIFGLIPEDEPSKLYIGRCKEFIHSPPPHNWDKVFTLKTK